ncbi:MAG: hypothetical protein U0840_04975 [Gemmataceae bacterium]
MQHTRILVLGLILTTCVQAQKPGDPSPEPPPDIPPGPISARLVAKKSTYLLDRQGMSADKYADAIRAGKLSPPEVDLSLELTNRTKEEVSLRITGASPRVTLTLKGKTGVVSVPASREREKSLSRTITIKPGEKYTLGISRLASYSSLSRETQHFWTEPGEYTLEVSLRTTLLGVAAARPVNRNPPAGGRGFTSLKSIELRTEPVRVSVVEKKP